MAQPRPPVQTTPSCPCWAGGTTPERSWDGGSQQQPGHQGGSGMRATALAGIPGAWGSSCLCQEICPLFPEAALSQMSDVPPLKVTSQGEGLVPIKLPFLCGKDTPQVTRTVLLFDVSCQRPSDQRLGCPWRGWWHGKGSTHTIPEKAGSSERAPENTGAPGGLGGILAPRY